MPGPTRSYNEVPNDPMMSDETRQFLSYLLSIANAVQPSLFPPNAPAVIAIPKPSAVQVVWNEVSNAVAYAVFQTDTPNAAQGVPVSTVPANTAGKSNSFTVTGINDTVKRYYSVQAIGNTNRSQVSTPIGASALASGATYISTSQQPINQNGVGGGTGGGGAIIGLGANVGIPS